MSPAKAKKNVGVIGLGIMGGSFSRNLIRSGWHVVGFDIDAAKRKELGKAGAEMARNAREIAAACPVGWRAVGHGVLCKSEVGAEHKRQGGEGGKRDDPGHDILLLDQP